MPLHEAVHQTVFRTVWLNRVLAFLTGLLTLRPPRHYTLYHYAHHRHTGVTSYAIITIIPCLTTPC